MPPFHGTGIVRNGKISTEYFYDLAYATVLKKRSPKLFYYDDKPFYIDIGGNL